MMGTKERTKRQSIRARQSRQRLYTRILLIGIGVILLIIFLWLVIGGLMKNKSDTSGIPQMVGTKQYSSAPPMLIDINKGYQAVVKLQKGGEFIIELYPKKAPITVNSFVFLARQGYYDGVTFHRVLEGFMAQTGDPSGTGSGGPGYTFSNESNDLLYDKAGIVGMANTGRPNSNGSQFFIMFGPYGLSEKDYTIFGQVIQGMDVVNAITLRDPTQNPSYAGDEIETVEIIEQ
jgi:peptidylprolyl isomerase